MDADGGLVEHAGAEVDLRGAEELNSVSDGSADEGGVALRVVAGERVDLEGNTGGGSSSWNSRRNAKECDTCRAHEQRREREMP